MANVGSCSVRCLTCSFLSPLGSAKCGTCHASLSAEVLVDRAGMKRKGRESPEPADQSKSSRATSSSTEPRQKVDEEEEHVPCPACTFHNSLGSWDCLVCGTALPNNAATPQLGPQTAAYAQVPTNTNWGTAIFATAAAQTAAHRQRPTATDWGTAIVAAHTAQTAAHGQKPTATNWGTTDWLWAHSAQAQRNPERDREADTESVLGRLSERYHPFKDLTVKEGALGSRELFTLASELVREFPHCTRSGKWIIMPGASIIDKIWTTVKTCVEAGELGPVAKVGKMDPNGSEDRYLICIYTRDFTDYKDVLRVFQKMVDLGFVLSEGRASKLAYKADLVTMLSTGSSTNATNGTFYSGTKVGKVAVVQDPEHFKSRSGKGQKFTLKE